ncbi:hypothetical protein CLAIMM_11448 [Cladophialophora immunda]|nr:hypothetical protein CLAIMM_11448 [Cladophialophora immunda]
MELPFQTRSLSSQLITFNMNKLTSFFDANSSHFSNLGQPTLPTFRRAELEQIYSTTPTVARSPPTSTLAAQLSDNSTTAAITSNPEKLSLEVWMATFAAANYHSFLQKMYDWETREWYYLLYYRGDIPYSKLSAEGRHFVKTIQRQKLVVEKSLTQRARPGEMRLEMWPTSSKNLMSCHYRCAWRLPITSLKAWEKGESDQSESLDDSGYNSAAAGDVEGENIMEGDVETNGEFKEETGHIDDEDLSYLERLFSVAFEVILWRRPSSNEEYYTWCTESDSRYHIRWEVERDAVGIAAMKLARGNAELGGCLRKGVVSMRRERHLVELLDDVVGQHPFQHNNLKDTLWRYSRRFRLQGLWQGNRMRRVHGSGW